MPDPLSKAKLDEIEKAAKDATPGKRSTFCKGVGKPPTGLVLHYSAQGQGVQSDADGGAHCSADDNLCAALDRATVLALVARARRADELEKRVAELEARVEYLS